MPVKEHLFQSTHFRRGHRTLSADKTLVQVEWAPDAEAFDLRSAAVVATAVADVDVPANACPMATGQVWEMDACGEAGPTRFEVVPVRLVAVRSGPNRFRRCYTWQFLVVRRPSLDPYRLFPRLGRPAIPEEDGSILGDLKALLVSEIADGAVARFNAEGGFSWELA